MGVKGTYVNLIGYSVDIQVVIQTYWNQFIWGPINVVLAADQEFLPVFKNPPKTDATYEVTAENGSTIIDLGAKSSKMESGNDVNTQDNIAVFLVWLDEKVYSSEEAS